MTTTYDLIIQQGKTLERLVRVETVPVVYKAITAISKAAPCRITSAGHGVVDGWRVAITGLAEGPIELNASKIPPRDRDFHQATLVSSSILELNEVSSADLDAYVSGGFLVYYTPVSLAGCAARMQIKNKVGGTELLLLTTSNGRLVLDDAAKTVLMIVDATTMAAITWKKGVYDLELIDGSNVVTLILTGSVTVEREVTTAP